MRRRGLLAVLVIAALFMSGCTAIFTAHVPDAYLTGGWAENVSERQEDSQFLGIGLKRVTLVYETTENQFNGPYPAAFLVTSLRILGGASREELFAELDRSLRDVLESQNVELDNASRVEGTRSLGQGQETLYFTYVARAEGGGGLFDQGRTIRILGEVFNDGASDLTVLLIGLAQVTGRSVFPDQTDTTHWSKIVGDPDGTIGGFRRTDGLAYNVVSHG